jgi:hypothetical protein
LAVTSIYLVLVLASKVDMLWQVVGMRMAIVLPTY